MTNQRSVGVGDGRVVRAHDSGPTGSRHELTVLWQHGSPHTGRLLAPLLDAAARHAVRIIAHARPGYGESTAQPGRRVRHAATDAARVADALGVQRFAAAGYSGGGPHALACAAQLPDRVSAVATFAGPAPLTSAFDWFAGMRAPGALRSATRGRTAAERRASRARFAETDQFDPDVFTDADWAALSGAWAALGEDAQRAETAGPGGLIDDDCALTEPWGFDLDAVTAPVLLVHGGADRVIPLAHGEQLRAQLPRAELRRLPDDGHVSVLGSFASALAWLRDRP